MHPTQQLSYLNQGKNFFLSEVFAYSTEVQLDIYQKIFLKFSVIDGKYILKISRDIIKHVYKVILVFFLDLRKLGIKSLSLNWCLWFLVYVPLELHVWWCPQIMVILLNVTHAMSLAVVRKCPKTRPFEGFIARWLTFIAILVHIIILAFSHYVDLCAQSRQMTTTWHNLGLLNRSKL